MAARLMRVVVPTAVAALMGSVVVLVLHLATGRKTSWWEWLAVAVLTLISAGISLWLHWRLLKAADRQLEIHRSVVSELQRSVGPLEDDINRVRQALYLQPWRQEVHKLQRRVDESKDEIEPLRIELRSLSGLLFEIASTILDDGAVPRSAVRVIPLFYYTSTDDPGIADEIERAISEIIETSGFVLRWTGPRESGSIRRRLLAFSKRVLSSDEARDVSKKIARAAELQIHEIPQSQVDSTLAEGVSKLLVALEKIDSAIVQLGSVIVLKVDGMLIVFTLTQLQISAITREPTLFSDPRALLEKLQSLRTNADGAHTGDVRPDFDDAVAGVSDVPTRTDIPPLPADDHLEPARNDPQVPDHERFCPNPECLIQGGQVRDVRPDQAEGCCPHCGTAFCFRPPLRPGTLVGDGQFRVERAITHGWLGWSYLAWDCRVPRWVILNSLIDLDEPNNSHAAVAELAALTRATHPNVVTVHTALKHPHPLTGKPIDYLVMEHVSGKSLEKLRQERPDSDPYLPVGQVCGFALDVLAGLDHLHVKCRLLYGDLSTDNVVTSSDGVKLIELRGVRRIDDQDSAVRYRPGYQDPKMTEHWPSVATDLYTVARLMAVLSFPFPGFSSGDPIPGPEEVELLARHPSFAGLLRRATHPDPYRRFASAGVMAEQLEGVLREIRAVQDGRPFPGASTRFGPELRVVGADPDTFPTGEGDPVAAALALSHPQVDPADQHVGLLATISAEGPHEIERILAALPDPSLETRLRVARARIELRHPEAGTDIDTLGQQQPGDWRVTWLRGLWSLIDGDLESARRSFTAVLDALPGEAAPKLALALCAARVGYAETAARGYATVWQTDRSYVSAAFGLARARFALGDHAGMAAVLETVPEGSRYAVTARLCAILARARGCVDGQPPVADFFTAVERLTILDLDEQQRELAVAEVLETVLSWERAGRPWPHGAATPIPATLLGRLLNERGVRNRLESAYRELTQLARPTTAERIAFVDKANHSRDAFRSAWRRIWS